MKKKNILLVLFLVVGILAASWCFGAEDMRSRISEPPLPSNIKVVPPNKTFIPPEVCAFSGKWQGRWSWIPYRPAWHGLNAKLVIKEIQSPSKAIVIYAVGDSPEWQIEKKSTPEVEAKIEKSEEGRYMLSFVTPPPGREMLLRFWFEGNVLVGRTPRWSDIELKRIPD